MLRDDRNGPIETLQEAQKMTKNLIAQATRVYTKELGMGIETMQMEKSPAKLFFLSNLSMRELTIQCE